MFVPGNGGGGCWPPPYLPTRPTSPFLYGPVDYFSKKKLHFGTSEQISTYGKINLLPIKSIYLVFSSRERKRRLIQTKIYYKLFYCLKRNISKSFKSDSCKKSFPSMYIIDKTCFDLCFLFHVIIGRHYFLRKSSTSQRFGVITMLLRSLTQVFWSRSALHFMVVIFNAANTKGPK